MNKKQKQEINKQLLRESKPHTHFFMYNTELGVARQKQINDWILSLNPHQYAMLSDLLQDAEYSGYMDCEEFHSPNV